MVTQYISRFQTLHLKKQVKMRASNGRDLLKGLRGGHVVITSRHGTGVGSMGRKVEEFELSTKLLKSEKLKNMVESGSKRMWEEMGYAEFEKVL